jgi:hypothetical protein
MDALIFYAPVFHFVHGQLGEKKPQTELLDLFQANPGFKEDEKVVLNFTGKS